MSGPPYRSPEPALVRSRILCLVVARQSYSRLSSALVQLFEISPTNNDDSAVGRRLKKLVQPLGGLVVMAGLWVLLIGVCAVNMLPVLCLTVRLGGWRYFRVLNALQTDEFSPARRTIVSLTIFLVAMVGVTFGLMVRTDFPSSNGGTVGSVTWPFSLGKHDMKSYCLHRVI